MSKAAKFTLLVLLTAGAFLAGTIASRHGPAAASDSAGVQTAAWSCPMHPQYRSDRPGDCPSCGMRLVRINGQAVRQDSHHSPDVQVSADTQQLIGLRTAEVRRSAESYSLRMPARLALDEARLYRVIAASDGWIRELGQNPAGTRVRKDEVLASYYVRDFVTAQQNYIYAYQQNAQTAPTQANVSPQWNTANVKLRLALDALRSLGMSDPQVAELERSGNPIPEMKLYSPVSGFVLARSISPGQRVDKGMEMYRIGDISRLWALADIFEKDQQFLKPGMAATIRYEGRELLAHLADALPQFDAQSRTLKARFELNNPEDMLRPDMFVDIEIEVKLPPAITAPADAIIDSGLRQTVYVDRGDGSFEARLVKTGWRFGDRVEISEGVQPGERIVTSGNFLIDSESRMKSPAMAAMTAAAPTAEDKQPLAQPAAGAHHDRSGH